MVLFETLAIYGVEQGAAYLRQGTAILSERESLGDRNDAATRMLKVDGLQRDDFGLFMSLADDNGVAEISYLVNKAQAKKAVIVPSLLVELNPGRFASRELIKKLLVLEYDEIAQFGLAALKTELDQRFGNGKA